MAHTPGPWLTQAEPNDEYMIWARAPHIGTLAIVWPNDINGDWPAKENAALIASAPDLLDALEYYMSGCTNEECEYCIRARAAIRKAKGEV